MLTKIYYTMQEAAIAQELEQTQSTETAPATTETEVETVPQPEVQGVEIDDATLLANLEERLEKGKFPIQNYTHQKLDSLIKFFKGKVKFKGIKEAYAIVAVQMDLLNLLTADGLLKPDEKIKPREYQLSVAAIQTIVYFLNNHESSGLAQAEDLMQLGVPFNNALSGIQAVDAKITELKKKIGITTEPQPIAQ